MYQIILKTNFSFEFFSHSQFPHTFPFLIHFCVPVDLNDLYAFHYTAPDIPDKQTGWNFFDLQSEYLRMGVPNENWTLSNINKDYEVCSLLVSDGQPIFVYRSLQKASRD